MLFFVGHHNRVGGGDDESNGEALTGMDAALLRGILVPVTGPLARHVNGFNAQDVANTLWALPKLLALSDSGKGGGKGGDGGEEDGGNGGTVAVAAGLWRSLLEQATDKVRGRENRERGER